MAPSKGLAANALVESQAFDIPVVVLNEHRSPFLGVSLSPLVCGLGLGEEVCVFPGEEPDPEFHFFVIFFHDGSQEGH
jgi:hypothetical protein